MNANSFYKTEKHWERDQRCDYQIAVGSKNISAMNLNLGLVQEQGSIALEFFLTLYISLSRTPYS